MTKDVIEGVIASCADNFCKTTHKNKSPAQNKPLQGNKNQNAEAN
jgi:hypothetical protein